MTHKIIGTASVLLIFAAATFAQRYRVIEIPLPIGYVTNKAASINDNGDVAGSMAVNTTTFITMGYTYKAGVTSAVGKLSAKGTFSSAAYISTTGVVVGDADTGDGRPQGFRKSGTSIVNVFPNNGGGTHALRIDAQGRIYGNFVRRGATTWQGAMWTPNPKKAGTYTETILGGFGLPTAFNSLGQAAGGSMSGVATAAFWNTTGTRPMQLLPMGPEYFDSIAYGISDSSDIVGAGFTATSPRPVRWNAGVNYAYTELPLPAGHNAGYAYGINVVGTVIGVTSVMDPVTAAVSDEQPVVWNAGSPFIVNQHLDPATSTGWTITMLVGINNKGQIVANARKAGIQRAVILTQLP